MIMPPPSPRREPSIPAMRETRRTALVKNSGLTESMVICSLSLESSVPQDGVATAVKLLAPKLL
jgi:hypothetical protein